MLKNKKSVAFLPIKNYNNEDKIFPIKRGDKFMRKSNVDVINGRLIPNIISYTMPIILTSVLQLMFNAADLIVVGNFCGGISVAAVGATGSISNLIVNLFIGLSVGAGVAVAQGIGSRDEDSIRRMVHTSLPSAVIGGIVITAVGIFFARPFLVMMDTPEEVLPLSVVYMQIYFGGMVFNLVYNFAAAILRAAGDTKSPLVFLTISGVVNVVLNIIFVTALHMDVAGVALATIISQALSALLVVVALMRRTDACKLELRKLRFYGHQLLKMLRIGLPAGIQGSLFSIANVIIQSSYNSFGDVALSGISAAINLEGFVYVCLAAYQQTAITFVGQNYGAGRYERIQSIYRALLICSGVTVLSVGLLTWAFGHQLLSIYIPGEEEAIAYGLTHVAWMCSLYFICGLMEATTGALRGLGASLVPMLISVLGICGIRVLWVYTIFQVERFHTLFSLILSYPISWTISFIAQLIAFLMIYNKKVKRMGGLLEKAQNNV